MGWSFSSNIPNNLLIFTDQETLMIKQSGKRLDQWEIDDQNKEQGQDICIKNLQTKFLNHVNSLNASILQPKNNTASNASACSSKNQKIEDKHHFSSMSESLSIIQLIDLEKQKKEKKRRSSLPYRVIKGDSVSGRVHGKATLELNNGCIFNGNAEYGQIQEGSMTYPNGAVYVGSFHNSLPHGPGSLVFPNGTQYKTVFKNGETTDQALIIYPNGDVYKGPIFRLKKHGVGKLLMKNGDKYIGDFLFGQITGQGTYYVNQKPVASGLWKKGQLVQKRRYSMQADYRLPM